MLVFNKYKMAIPINKSQKRQQIQLSGQQTLSDPKEVLTAPAKVAAEKNKTVKVQSKTR